MAAMHIKWMTVCSKYGSAVVKVNNIKRTDTGTRPLIKWEATA
jgi:hypothetical protein